MRDIFILTAIIAIVIAALRKPQIGVLGWLWLSIMNPHREAYGWIYTLPVLDTIAAVTIFSFLIHFKKENVARVHPLTVLLVIFFSLMCISTLFSISYDLSVPKWIDTSKTFLFVAFMLLCLNKRHWIIAAIWVFIFSVSYTGIKGGLFTILTGGSARIWGAPGTAWGDNNGVSLAMLMLIPLFFAMKDILAKKTLRFGVYIGAFLSFITILGTQSRGGLVGIIGTTFAFFVRTRHKMLMGSLIVIAGIGVLAFMPDSWKNRMETIQTYEQDESASSRIVQWKYAVQLAADSPIIGHGFDARYYRPFYQKYMEGIDINRSVHSNYFQILEEMGYLGLFIYLLLLVLSVVSAHRASRLAPDRPDLQWAKSLLYYSQFSIVGYATNGLTINVAYLDLFYYIIAFIVLLIGYLKYEIENPPASINEIAPNRI